MTGGPDASRIGETVGGKYRIVRLLAKGGMGVVYEALHAVVRRRFAIKFLRRDLAERREILNRFQREAEAAGALENENVAASVDFGISDDGAPYIVMEYLVGENLADLLAREGCLPVERGRRSGRAGLPRRRRRARGRDRPPRSQAAQPVRLRAATTGPTCSRCSTSASPSCRRSTRPAASTRTRDGARHRRVHVARAGARREAGRPAGRRLRAGRDPLRAALGEAPAPGRITERDPAPHRDAAGGAARVVQPDLPAGLVEIIGRPSRRTPRPDRQRRMGWPRSWRHSRGAKCGRRRPRPRCRRPQRSRRPRSRRPRAKNQPWS